MKKQKFTANRVVETTLRGNSSRIATEMKRFEFNNPVNEVHVSQRAPASIKHNGTTPAKEGWAEMQGNDLSQIGNPDIPCDVWIKTATLAGRRRTWVRKIY